jgi:tRNA threonylcarbamoyl adenosine modification protein YeaZ
MILALETSTPHASLAVYSLETQGIEWRSSFETKRSHNSVIFGPVTEALDQFGDQLTRVAVGLGPGSYSGVRVAIAVANGLALSRELPLQGVSSLEAYGDVGETCFVVGDARRKTFFLAEVKGGKLEGEPDLLSAEDLESRLQEIDESEAVYSPDDSVLTRFPSIRQSFPSAEKIAKRASLSSFDVSEGTPPLEPHYLRAPFITTPKTR